MTSSSNKTTVTSQDFYYNFQLGFAKSPTEVAQDKDHLNAVESRYVGAICTAIGSGGVYTEEQTRFIKGLIAIGCNNQKLLNSVDALLAEASDLLDVELMCSGSYFTDLHLLRNAGRSMVFDMYRCAELAGYPQEQMVAVALIAEELGVSEFGLLERIKAQVDMDAAVRRNRIKLLFPDGHPLLEERYAADLHKEEQ